MEDSKSQFPIVRRICAFLNLGDQGKLDSFFGKVKRQLEKEIKFNQNNIKSEQLTWEHKAFEHQDSLEDAKKALDDAFMQVDLSRIQSNEEQKKYVDIYLFNIDRKREDLTKLEKEYAKELDAHQDKLKDLEDQIKAAEARLKVILS